MTTNIVQGFVAGGSALGLPDSTAIPTPIGAQGGGVGNGGIIFYIGGVLYNIDPNGFVTQLSPIIAGTTNTQAGYKRLVKAFVRTTTTSAVNIYTYQMPASGVHTVSIKIHAVRIDTVNPTTDSGSGEYYGAAEISSGTINAITGMTNLWTAGTIANSVSYITSGSTLIFQVFSNTSNACDYTFWLEFFEN